MCFMGPQPRTLRPTVLKGNLIVGIKDEKKSGLQSCFYTIQQN